jgi:hypothetical protein
MTGGQTRTFNIPSSGCGIPTTAVAYSLNFTVVPPAGGPAANLTTWPTGGNMPNVSTLNYYGNVVANAAIVPAGTNGSINVFINYTRLLRAVRSVGVYRRPPFGMLVEL